MGLFLVHNVEEKKADNVSELGAWTLQCFQPCADIVQVRRRQFCLCC